MPIPRRVKACDISVAMGPAPIITMLAGARSRSHRVSLVRKPASCRPSMGGTTGRLPVQMRMNRASRSRSSPAVPSPSTRTVLGPTTRAWPRMISTPVGLEAVGVVVGGRDLLLDGPDALPDEGRVDVGGERRQAVGVGHPHGVGRLGRGEEGLARDAARPQAVAADPAPLDHGHPQADGGRELGSDHPARTHTDDDEVVARHIPNKPPCAPLPRRLYPGAPRLGRCLSTPSPASSTWSWGWPRWPPWSPWSAPGGRSSPATSPPRASAWPPRRRCSWSRRSWS